MAGRSDSPPPFHAPKASPISEHSLLPSCSAAFAGLEVTLKTITSEMKGMRRDVQEMGRVQSGQAESIKGVWHEIRDEINPAVKEIPGKIAQDFKEHEGNCPARRRAMRKAESGGSSDQINARALIGQHLEEHTGTIVTQRRGIIRNSANGHYEIPRPILWIGGLIGAAVAASGYVYHLLTMSQ